MIFPYFQWRNLITILRFTSVSVVLYFPFKNNEQYPKLLNLSNDNLLSGDQETLWIDFLLG